MHPVTPEPSEVGGYHEEKAGWLRVDAIQTLKSLGVSVPDDSGRGLAFKIDSQRRVYIHYRLTDKRDLSTGLLRRLPDYYIEMTGGGGHTQVTRYYPKLRIAIIKIGLWEESKPGSSLRRGLELDDALGVDPLAEDLKKHLDDRDAY